MATNTIIPYIYKALISTSIVSFVIGGITESKTSLGAYIAGYSVLILGICVIIISLFKNPNPNMFDVLYIGMPFLSILAIIAYMLYLLIYYKRKILEGHVSSGYHSFSNIIVVLMLVQLYVVYDNSNDDVMTISKGTLSIMYLLNVLIGIAVVILNTILKYYSTDGFQVLRI